MTGIETPTWLWAVILAGVFSAVQAVLLLLFNLWRTALAASQREITTGLKEDVARLDQWLIAKEEVDLQFKRDEYAKAITNINESLWTVRTTVSQNEKDIDRLREWRHATVDPCIPRAIDELQRRIDRLEARTFNGSNNGNKS